MSTLKVTNIQATGETASRAVSGVAAAWVNFNGSGTPAARNSLNFSSITDNGTGDFTVNLTNNFAAADYAILVTADRGGAAGLLTSHLPGDNTTLTVSSFEVRTFNGTSYALSAVDQDGNYATAHGDLA